jgi:Zn-dependent peptidase ImmA (M78 family)
MIKRVTIPMMHSLIDELRSVAPNRPLTYGESLQLTHVQASRLRRWAEADQPDINLLWLIRQRAIPVNFVPSYKLGEESGLTTDHIEGRLQMFINQNEPRVRQRFSVLHELKHVLDFERADVLHAKLGSGNAKRRADMIEWIANEFAAHVLMPTGMVKRLWFSSQDVSLMASLFNVSMEAMSTRLDHLGLTGEQATTPRTYFRTNRMAFPPRLDWPWQLGSLMPGLQQADELLVL